MTITQAPGKTTTAQAPAPRPRLNLEPYLYLLPHALLFFVFTVYPVGYGIYIATHRWDLLAETQAFVGSEYFRNLFTPGSPQFEFFWRTLINTAFFTVVTVPLLVASSLGLAVLLHRPIFGRAFSGPSFSCPAS
ncbi:carbohydrate ABC transporter permease [Deinococcus malanensis]|uniref:carbohydrate ABC transporter permease n=1 Tax=Deinococcus malanensis TaxID=1706855 RepID=UPI0036308BD4